MRTGTVILMIASAVVTAACGGGGGGRPRAGGDGSTGDGAALLPPDSASDTDPRPPSADAAVAADRQSPGDGPAPARDGPPPGGAPDAASGDMPIPTIPDAAAGDRPLDRAPDLFPDRAAMTDVTMPPPLAEDCGPGSGLQAGAPWPTYRRCSTRRGAIGVRSVHHPVELWTYALAAGEYVATEFTIARDGTLYFGVGGGLSSNTRVQALGFDGRPRWHVAGAQPRHPPTIAADGSLRFAHHNFLYRAVNADGSDRWRYPTTSYVVCDALGPDGTSYLGHMDGTLTALTASGQLRFTKTFGEVWEVKGLAIALDGNVIVGLATKTVALRPDGTDVWSAPFGASAAPSIGADGAIHVPSGETLAVLEPSDGAVRWTGPIGLVSAALALGPDGSVFGADIDDRVWAFGPAGARRWLRWQGTYGYWAPVVGGDGTVYLSGGDGTLLAFAPEGEVKWAQHRGTGHLGIGADGTLYAVTGPGVVALGCAGGACGACRPRCGARTCGPDGCGGQCGACPGGQQCQLALGSCVPIAASPADACGDLRGHQAGAPWPVARGCMNHPGRGRSAGPAANPTVRWTYDAGARITAEPSIAADGTVYAGDAAGKLHAVRPDGSAAWAVTLGRPQSGVGTTPVIGVDGTIYVGAGDATYAVAPDGTVRWRVLGAFTAGNAPAIGPDGVVYAPVRGYTTKGKLAALDPWLGVIRWAIPTRGAPSSPVFADGQVLTFDNDNLFFLSAADGTARTTTALPNYGTPQWVVRSADGTIYRARGPLAYAFRPDGTERWRVQFSTDLDAVGGVALGADGSVIIATSIARPFAGPARLFALDPADGRERWHADLPSHAAYSPVVDAAGAIYVACTPTTLPATMPGELLAFDQSGRPLWRTRVGATASAPAVVAGGTLYVGGDDGKLRALVQGP